MKTVMAGAVGANGGEANLTLCGPMGAVFLSPCRNPMMLIAPCSQKTHALGPLHASYIRWDGEAWPRVQHHTMSERLDVIPSVGL